MAFDFVLSDVNHLTASITFNHFRLKIYVHTDLNNFSMLLTYSVIPIYSLINPYATYVKLRASNNNELCNLYGSSHKNSLTGRRDTLKCVP
jgi:hypothetical protein